MPKARFDKYFFYEQSVQSPAEDVQLFLGIYRNARGGREPSRLREDFCGTFAFACEWVKLGDDKTAVGLDLDPEPLDYGQRHHYSQLTPGQKKRLRVERRNVISVSREKADLIVANNFSFYIFRERKTLVEYFKHARLSLGPQGMLALEMVGGPGFIEKNKEQRTIKEKGKTLATYVWDQRKFNPINREAQYSIHFRLPDGSVVKDAFTYHWRVWTIPEVRDALAEAGFRETQVYWETSSRGEGTGEYARSEQGDNDWTWLAYVAALP